MRKSRKKRPVVSLIPQFRINDRIRSENINLIDANGVFVGVVSLAEALRRAAELELDLVEVNPKAEPPVCKILDYGSFKYKKEKEARAQKQKQKVVEMKGVRLSLKIGSHDREIRLLQAKNFLADNNKVRVEIILRGRERQYTNQARVILNDFATELKPVAKIEQSLTVQGGTLSLVLTPNASQSI